VSTASKYSAENYRPVADQSTCSAVRGSYSVQWPSLASSPAHKYSKQWRYKTALREHSTTPLTTYSPFSGTTRVSQCQKRTSGLYGTRGD